MFKILNGLQSDRNVKGLFLAAILTASASAHAGIIEVSPASLTRNGLVDFEDLGLGITNQVHYNSVFSSGLAQFGERFEGQTVSASGNFDELGGAPAGSLKLTSGMPGKNVTVTDGGAGSYDFGNTSIAGSGSLGYPSLAALGEGSIAILFDFDQSELGFDIIGAQSGSVNLQFWKRDGSLFDTLQFMLGNDAGTYLSYGFKTEDASFSIAGVSITNNDPGGIGFDNFVFDVTSLASVPGIDPPPGKGSPGTVVDVSEPPFIAAGLFALLLLRLRRKA